MLFEYTVTKLDARWNHPSTQTVNHMNDMGLQGWRLVQVMAPTAIPGAVNQVFYWIRPRK